MLRRKGILMIAKTILYTLTFASLLMGVAACGDDKKSGTTAPGGGGEKAAPAEGGDASGGGGGDKAAYDAAAHKGSLSGSVKFAGAKPLPPGLPIH